MNALRIACLQTRAYHLEEASTAAAELLALVDDAAPGSDLLLLPECAYPAYVLTTDDLDQTLRRLGAPTTGEFLEQLAVRARSHGVNIAAGLALQGEGGLENALVVIDRQGRVIARTAKQFLWHFDGCWFTCGNDYVVAEIDGVRAGLFICADGRMPEIPRILALRGARLFLDATNWVTAGRDPANLPNAQPDYMMSVRAAENGCWLAAANKAGREQDTVVYCGKSLVLRADGSVAARAPSDVVTILRAEIPLGADGQPEGSGQMPAVRRPDEYRALGSVYSTPEGPAPAPYAAVIQADDPEVLVAAMERHGVTLALAGSGQIWVDGHLRELPRRQVLETSVGRLGLFTGDEGWLPEVPRLLALQGADILLWSLPQYQPWVESVARTRAAENRCFVMVATPPGQGGESLIVDPSGAVLTRTFPGQRQAVATLCPTALARLKAIVPGTDAMRSRLTERYGDLWATR